MTNYFCCVCGTLMYRVSSGVPEKLVGRIGTVDDFDAQEGVLRLRIGMSGPIPDPPVYVRVQVLTRGQSSM